MYVAYEWNLLQTVPCLAHSGRLDALSGWHGDNFTTEGAPETLAEVGAMILATLKVKVLPWLGPGASAGARVSTGCDPETHPRAVNRRRSPDARREACAESGKSPRDQG